MRHKTTLLLVALSSLSTYAQISSEIRGAWLSTEGGADWPQGIYDVALQKQSLCTILDKLVEANFNAVYFQVQSDGTVLWNSTLAPSSSNVTGNGSLKLSYDVASYVIEQCHKRGLECQALVSPLCVGSKSNANSYSSNSVSHILSSNPGICISYNGIYYLDPALKGTQDYLVSLYTELLSKYNFDGLTITDLQYPGSDFGDGDSYADNNPNYWPKDKWRINNLTTLIKSIHDAVKDVNPNIKLCLSTAGAYKSIPGYSTKTAYSTYYQDTNTWLKNNYIDIVMPKEYFSDNSYFVAYIADWTSKNADSQVVPCLDFASFGYSTIETQITESRAQNGIYGIVLNDVSDIASSAYQQFKSGAFKDFARIPTVDNISTTRPVAPSNLTYKYENGKYSLSWNYSASNTDLRYFTVYQSESPILGDASNLAVAINATTEKSALIASDNANLNFAVTAVNYNYVESSLGLLTAVNDILAASDIKANVSDRVLFIDVPSAAATVTVYSITGALMMTHDVHETHTQLTLADLSSGVYIAKITSLAATKSIKFVIP
jgi:uncharacterized lipoprotein YddW (UPF0748 family)